MRALGPFVVAAVLLFVAGTGDATPPCCAPLPPRLVAWWQGQNDANDVLGAHNGTLVGDSTFAQGEVGQGFSFDGDGDYVSVPDTPALYSAGSFSVDAWVKTTTGGVVIAHYECGGSCTGGSSNSEWQMQVAGGHLDAFIRDVDASGDVSGGQELIGSAAVADGAFHHLAAVRDTTAGKLLLYVDGTLDTSAVLNGGADSALGSDAGNDSEADPVTIGAVLTAVSGAPQDLITGVVDEPRYFDTALTPEQVAAIAAAGANGACTDEVPPASAVTAPPTGTLGQPIIVSYSASDNVGVARVILLVRTPGATGFTEAATDTTGSGSFSYTPTAPGDYGFATSAEDANCGREAAPAEPDAITKVAVAAATPANTPPAPTPVPITQIASLPSPRVCVSRRHFPIHLKGVKGIVKAVIKLTGVPARTVKGKALGLPIDLRGLPKGKVVVRITVTTKGGKRLVGKRTYHTCANKRIIKKRH